MIQTLLTVGLAALAAAVTQPVGEPTGNPIARPGLNELVPVGREYEISWQPTCEGTITLLLLRGPSTNVVPLGAPITERAPNTGSFLWTPPTTLDADTSRYGLQIICDLNGQYQYSTQFGIDNPGQTSEPVPESSSTVVESSSSHVNSTHVASSTPHPSGVHYVTEVVSEYVTYCPYPTEVVMNGNTYVVEAPMTLTITDCPCTITKPVHYPSVTPTTSSYKPVVTVAVNSTVVYYPTDTVTASSTVRASPSGTGAPILGNSATGQATLSLGAIFAAIMVFALRY